MRREEHLGAHRSVFDENVALARLVLIGEDNPQSSAPEHALFPAPAGCAGNRLQEKILGLRRATYLSIWRTNLCNPTWSAPAAHLRAGSLLAETGPWDVMILLGSKVAGVFGKILEEKLEPFTVTGIGHMQRVVCLPHPSGRNLVYNHPLASATARKILSEVCPDVPWGEDL